MIDIEPYQHKLEILKEYMGAKIDGKREIRTIAYEWLPIMSAEQIMNVFFQTGYLVTAHPERHLCPTATIMNFDEYYQSKINPK